MQTKRFMSLLLTAAITLFIGIAPMATGNNQPVASAAGLNDKGNRVTLDVERQNALKRLYIDLATGKAFSGAEAQVISAFMRGDDVSEMEADTVISRALYAKNISNDELSKEQQALLATFETLGRKSNGFDIAKARVQREDSEVVGETEPNDMFEQSNSAQTNFFAGKLSGSSDVDIFAFSVPGGQFAVSLNGQSRGKRSRADVKIEVLDESGNLLSPDSEFDASERSLKHLAILSSQLGGKYFARISEASEAVVKYRLAVETLSIAQRQGNSGEVSLAAFINNGGFETGNFTGWTLFNQACFPGGSWFVYNGTTTPFSGLPFSAPPQGTFAAVTDQVGPGTQILYQNVALEPGRSHALLFRLSYRNLAGVVFNPNTLDCTVFPNQQFRIDIMTTGSPVTSVAPGDVLANVFRTTSGTPTSIPVYVQGLFNLSPFAGQTIRLRFAVVETQFFFNVGVDDVRIATN